MFNRSSRSSTQNKANAPNNNTNTTARTINPQSASKGTRAHHHIVTINNPDLVKLSPSSLPSGSENHMDHVKSPTDVSKVKGVSLTRRASDSSLQKTSLAAHKATPHSKHGSSQGVSGTKQRTFLNSIAKKATVNPPENRKPPLSSNQHQAASPMIPQTNATPSKVSHNESSIEGAVPMDLSVSIPSSSNLSTTPKSRLGPPRARNMAATRKLALPSAALTNGAKSPTLQSPTGISGPFGYGVSAIVTSSSTASPEMNSPLNSASSTDSFITSAVRRKTGPVSPSPKSPAQSPSEGIESPKTPTKAHAKRVASLTKIDVAEPKMPRQVSKNSLLSPTKDSGLVAMDTSEPPSPSNLEGISEDVKVDEEIFSPAYHSISIAKSSSVPPAVVDDSGKVSETTATIVASHAVTAQIVTRQEQHQHLSTVVVEDIVSTEETDVQNEVPEEDEFDPFYLIRILPPLTKDLSLRPQSLPKKTRSSPPITLVLDLDETLVHCSTTPLPFHDMTFNVNFNGMLYKVCGRIRPHYKAFLERVSQLFEVVIFTASQKIYADQVLDVLDPEHKYFRHRLFRDSCLFVSGNYLKDLNVLGRDLSKTIIVDNSPQAFGYQLSNGIPITSWYDDYEDQELLHVLAFLESIANVEDVRPYIRERYQLEKIIFGRFLS